MRSTRLLLVLPIAGALLALSIHHLQSPQVEGGSEAGARRRADWGVDRAALGARRAASNAPGSGPARRTCSACQVPAWTPLMAVPAMTPLAAARVPTYSTAARATLISCTPTVRTRSTRTARRLRASPRSAPRDVAATRPVQGEDLEQVDRAAVGS
jgi:hypothetical protein